MFILDRLITSCIFFSVKYRIHVPHKIHTVFVTKVVKVPEHHHHHHEVKKEEHHHHHKKTEHKGYGDEESYDFS